MNVKHITHNEWFQVIDTDLDCDFETGEYIGLYDMLKLSDGNWYPQRECVYLTNDGDIAPCQ